MYRMLGGDIIVSSPIIADRTYDVHLTKSILQNMSALPEAKLAREAEIRSVDCSALKASFLKLGVLLIINNTQLCLGLHSNVSL